MNENKIIIGSDHAGYFLKEELREYLQKMNMEIEDVGAYSADAVDYPDFGAQVAAKVSCGKYSRGILVCGSGVGMSIVANKFPGIRAALCLDEETARLSRMHNNANILVLAGRKTNASQAGKIVKIWLETPFEGGRHERRVEKIGKIEKALCRQD